MTDLGLSEPTSQHDVTKPVQGVEHRQDAYRPPALREATVIFTPPVASQCSSHAHSSTTVMQQQKVSFPLFVSVVSLKFCRRFGLMISEEVSDIYSLFLCLKFLRILSILSLSTLLMICWGILERKCRL